MKGKLIILEGPDNVGKTTISKNLIEILKQTKIRTRLLAFPGNRKGTLGKFIHDFHHKYDKYGIEKMPSASLQLLHVAAHFDTIHTDIVPALEKNDFVVLDRFWWSTYVYGKVGGVREEVLKKIIEIEMLAWEELNPDHVFLIENRKPFGVPLTKTWIELRSEYIKLAENQTDVQQITFLKNNKSVDVTAQKIIETVGLNNVYS